MIKASNAIAIIVTLAIIAAIIAGLVAIGSPAHNRLERMDLARASDIYQIALRLNDHYRNTGEILVSLDHLQLKRSNGSMYRDPISGDPYELIVGGSDSFQLCAIFETDGPHIVTGRFGYDVNPEISFRAIPISNEGIGRHCFEFSLPPQTR